MSSEGINGLGVARQGKDNVVFFVFLTITNILNIGKLLLIIIGDCWQDSPMAWEGTEGLSVRSSI